MRVRSSHPPSIEIVIESLETEERAVIPTTFVPLAPDRILIGSEIDVLFGLFHIMWKDMPKPRTYPIRLADRVTKEGSYLGCSLECGSPRTRTFKF
ncbi:MAG: hypothetical protein ACYCPP_08065 [Nitrososphaerales archaeon]